MSLFSRGMRYCSTISIWKRNCSSACATQNEPEIDSKVLETRAKDMPESDMDNPFKPDKMKCILCEHNITPNYKNVKLLSQFVSPYTGRIYGKHITRLCTIQQERVEREIRKAQKSGFMAYYLKEVEFLKDPKLFNPEQPIRPHRF